MKKKTMKAIAFMALTLGIGSIAEAQEHIERVVGVSGISLRANSDSSNHEEYFRFYTGRQDQTNGTNYIAELNHSRLILNGRDRGQGTNVIDPAGSHFSIQSNRGLVLHADVNNNPGNNEQNMRFYVAGRLVTEIDTDGVSMRRLKAKNGNLTIGTNNTDVMNISDNRVEFNRNIILNIDGHNNVGIGTANPTEGLHIFNENFRLDRGQFQSSGAITLHPDIDRNGNDLIEFRNSTNEKMASIQDGNIDLFIRGNNGGEIRSNGSIKFKPEVDEDGSNDVISFYNGEDQEMVRIQDGIIQTNEVRLNMTSFPDYVFAKDYELMTLNKVKEYIQKNKHLPNMPSEKEVVTNGMNVSQINTILVEKVEELTLYTINQEEQLQSQKQKIELLLKRIETLEAAGTNK